ncbi:hypothetical protein ACFO9Q_11050 [Paenibacillus sp. GCM10023252]|uniref:hypothetical protein n=1 Tax=Paenibacillus sp. GCM10023252 TaxID=3252649 RepID=UPI00360BE93A
MKPQNRNRYIGVSMIIVGLLILIIVPQLDDTSTERFFYISGHGEQVGEVPNAQETVYYSITLQNQDNKTYKIKAIEPIIPLEIRKLILDDKVQINKRATLKKNGELEFEGQFIMNTAYFSQNEIKALLPMIDLYKIRYDENEEILLNTKGQIVMQ